MKAPYVIINLETLEYHHHEALADFRAALSRFIRRGTAVLPLVLVQGTTYQIFETWS